MVRFLNSEQFSLAWLRGCGRLLDWYSADPTDPPRPAPMASARRCRAERADADGFGLDRYRAGELQRIWLVRTPVGGEFVPAQSRRRCRLTQPSGFGRSEGERVPLRSASTHPVTKSSALRPWRLQVSTAVSIRSAKRLPALL